MTISHSLKALTPKNSQVSRSPAGVVKYLLINHPLTDGPMRLDRVIVSIILNRGWESNWNLAAEQAAKWEPRVKQRLQTNLSELQRQGRPARICFNSSDPSYVQGACFVEPTDSQIVRKHKHQRSRLQSYLTLIRDLTPEEFELLCRRLIGLLGVASPHLTRRTADDGIDFYGQIPGQEIFFPRDLEPTIQHQLSIWLVGQAKHWDQVGTPEIRELVGAVGLARSGVSSTKVSPFPNLVVRIHDPVLIMLVTGGTLSARAWELVRQSGIVGIDGELLAAFLADRETQLGDEPKPESFRQWLDDSAKVDVGL